MSEKEYLNEWIQKAEKDLKTVGILQDYPDMTEIICFHCQQAAEKYLKVLLLSHDEEITKTHNIDYLLSLCTKFDDEFISYIGSPLPDYAVNIRYPDLKYIPTAEETNDAIKLTNEIIELVKANLKK